MINQAEAQGHRDQIKRAHRVESRHEATAVDSAGREYEVTVVDVSNGGFKLECDSSQVGDFVAFRMPRYGDFRIQIRWAAGDAAGGVFLDPIDFL